MGKKDEAHITRAFLRRQNLHTNRLSFPNIPEISSAPLETTKTNASSELRVDKDDDDDDDDDGEENRSPDKKEKMNGFKESDESDQSKDDIQIEETKPSETRRKTAKLISSFSSLNLFTRVRNWVGS